MKPTTNQSSFFKRAFPVFCALLLLVWSAASHAQVQNLQSSSGVQRMVVGSSYLLLQEGSDAPFFAAPVTVYVQEEAGKPLGSRAIDEMISKQKGIAYALPDVSHMGGNDQAVWMVLPLYNRTNITDWDLHLGFDLGLHAPRIKNISVYQGETGFALPARMTQDGRVVISIPRQAYTQVLVRVEPQQGWPLILRPALTAAGNQPAFLFAPMDTAAKISLLAGILLVGMFLISWRFEQLFLGIAVLLQSLLVGGISVADSLMPIQIAALGIGAFLAAGKTRNGIGQNGVFGAAKVLLYAIIAIAIATAVSLYALPQHTYWISLGAYLAAQTLALVMIMIAATKHMPGGWLVFISLLLPLVGAAIALPFIALVPGVRFELFFLCTWNLGVLFQNLLLLITCYIQYLGRPKYQPIIERRSDKDVERVNSELRDKLKASQETLDHERLLRVLEQERIQMQVLRESEQQKAEEMRIAKEAADEANRARSAFFAVISHEIRTPMNGVLGMVRLLLQTSLSKDQKNYATTIQESGQTMMTILNDILDLEKIERGKMNLEEIEVDLHQLLTSLHTLLLGHAAAKNIELKLEIDQLVPQFVMTDPTRLRQVLLNLLSNAVKFTEVGSVTLIVRPMDENQAQRGGKEISLYFAIQDTGIGISLQAQRNLFSPFMQAEASTARKFGGSGLGLVICQKLVERMGGEINISSREGEGSTFFFVLPFTTGNGQQLAIARANEMTGNEQASAAAIATEITPLKIAIIDDNEINHRVLAGYLDPQGHMLTHYNNAAETIAGLTADPYGFDLILMDLEMPDGNGMDVTRKVRAAGVIAPIMALTGHTDEEIIRACMESGMNDYLPKPVEPETLQRIIRNTLSDVYVPPATMLPSAAADDVALAPPPSFAQSYSNNTDSDDEFPFAVRSVETVAPQVTDEVTLDSNLFNTSMLAPLKESLGEDGMNELLADLYKTCEETIRVMEESLENGNQQEILAKAHDLKGMAGNFGLTDLSNRAAEIDNILRHNEDASTVPEKVKSLTHAYEGARQALENWIKS